ncbi:ABC transporter ATP-binding protein [Leucobacter sp. cx-42]|uniref:ABC transporter ATP-binding protein n=1 Tax=unclassified Leucobacter TaxID=2621730 RepID=UPI00165E7795|nr:MULTISPECIES: ABC transporter ATP-binding protein [unclassified Leucobacter]MBC9953424.1 ABC transporter ATP-binding protein [Leucobacter sp. cx-42]
MSSVALESVSLAFPDGHLGLADIDLTIGDGEFIALVGPSGSGKTTLLRAVAGFARPTAGTIRIGDEIVASADRAIEPEHRGLGMVFQQHAIWPHWNVGRNVAYPLKRAGVSRAERDRRVAEVLDLVGLAGTEKRNPATLSGGQRQRVAIARAIVARPRVLLLDEALSALDEPLRDRLRLELRALTRELGLTVIFVTHDRGEALAIADRVVVLDGGRIQQQSTPAELLARPATPFVAKFIADATIVPGALTRHRFVAAGHELRVPAEVLGSTLACGAVELAICPEDVRVVADPDGPAIVRSSLFGRECDDLMLDWAGLSLRSRVSGTRAAVGDRVRIEITSGTLYPSDSQPTPMPQPSTQTREPASLAA